MNIEDKIKALETQLEELKAEWEKQSTPEEWLEYYFIAASGVIGKTTSQDDIFYNGCKSIGNIFRTEEEAQAEIEARKVVAELRMTDGRVDVYNSDVNFPEYYGINVVVGGDVQVSDECFDFFLAWDSEEAVEKAVEKVGEDRILAAAKHFARV